MTKMSGSRRISSAMASRSASRTVIVTISVPSGISGSGSASIFGGAATAGCAGAFASLAGRCCEAGGADSAAFCVLAGLPPSLSAEASSPSARIMAIGVLTATSLVPSGTRIFPSVPSSTASTSMVALSVSISAMTSPDLTASPSFLCHLARLPFSIVGESAVINTSIGMDSHVLHGVDVGPELGGIRLRVVGGEFRCLVDDGAHLGVNFLQRILGRKAFLQQAAAHLLDWIVLGAHLVDFLLRPVLGRIGHRVTAVAVGQHFEDDRAVALAAPFHRLVTCGLDRPNIHAIDLFARDVEGAAALGQVRGG